MLGRGVGTGRNPHRTHPSWGPPRRTRSVSTCLPVARSTDASSAAFSSSSPRPEIADTARTPEHGGVYLRGWEIRGSRVGLAGREVWVTALPTLPRSPRHQVHLAVNLQR